MPQNSPAYIIHQTRAYWQNYHDNLLITFSQNITKINFDSSLKIIKELENIVSKLKAIADYEFKLQQPDSKIITTLEEFLKQN